jgi:SAM-dependent methyltransferase
MNEPDPIPRRSFLDPRERLNAEGAPFEDAVHIPCSELPGRTHELPARDELVRVVGPPALRQATIEWLRAHGRRAAAADAPFASGPAAAATAPFAAAPGARAPGRLWAPNALLREVAPQLDPGAALDLACGVGRETVFLAASGWRVVAVDRLEDALQRGRALAATYGLGARIEWLAGRYPADSIWSRCSAFCIGRCCPGFRRGCGRAAACFTRPSRPPTARGTASRAARR